MLHRDPLIRRGGVPDLDRADFHTLVRWCSTTAMGQLLGATSRRAYEDEGEAAERLRSRMTTLNEGCRVVSLQTGRVCSQEATREPRYGGACLPHPASEGEMKQRTTATTGLRAESGWHLERIPRPAWRALQPATAAP